MQEEFWHLNTLSAASRRAAKSQLGHLTSKQNFVGNSTLAMDLLMKEIIHLGGRNINLIIKNK